MLTNEEVYLTKADVKPMTISNFEKSKLYEMATAIIINNNKWSKVHLFDTSVKIPKQKEKEFGYDTIHWFELCTTHLAYHIMDNPVKYLEYCSQYAMNPEGKIHPVEYLYTEYQLIKELFI